MNKQIANCVSNYGQAYSAYMHDRQKNPYLEDIYPVSVLSEFNVCHVFIQIVGKY